MLTNFMFTQMIMCSGCSKVAGWNATGWICPVYLKPHMTIAARRQVSCPFNPHQSDVKAIAKKVNPLKAAKRARRGK